MGGPLHTQQQQQQQQSLGPQAFDRRSSENSGFMVRARSCLPECRDSSHGRLTVLVCGALLTSYLHCRTTRSAPRLTWTPGAATPHMRGAPE